MTQPNFPQTEPDNWRNKIMELVKKHDLGFLHNPGGGQFTNADKGINIQVPLCDYQQDYEQLLSGLCALGLEEPSPPFKP